MFIPTGRIRAFYFCIIVIVSFATSAVSQDLSNLSSQKPFTLNGAVSLSTTGYSASGIPDRREPFSWTIVGSPVASIYGIQLPFSFIISEQERSFRQPFNQFGISPQYKFITLHLGYSSMSMSRYTLAGVTFLGAGIELTPSPLRFSAMYGRLQRAVEEDTTQPDNIPAYQRMGYAMKLGFGTDAGYFDIDYFHAKDDTNSLSHPPVKADITPSENSVLGLAAKVPIIPQLSLEGEVAASLFTTDLRSPTLNFDSSSYPQFLNGIFDFHTSTSLTFAEHADLNYNIPHFGIKLEYERIEPDFNSLGAYYFTTDIENWTIGPHFDVFDSKLRVGGSIGIQHDNILNTKAAQTQRLIGSGNVSWNPAQVFGIDVQYTNYSTNQGAGSAPINDSIRVRNVSQSMSLAPRVLLQSADMNHSITLVTTIQQYTDLNAFTNALTNSQTKMATIGYTIAFIQAAKSLGISLLYSNTQSAGITTTVAGVNLNGSMTIVNNTITLGAGLGYTVTNVDAFSSSGNTITENINGSYRVTKLDNIGLSLYATQNSGNTTVASQFQEVTLTLNYTHTLSFF
ncbi:MAG TPA: hypothetical protein VFA55_00515 [Candidatus Kapabacteria bacterium]|nr:hypothetical protein [Candidatus Kapabacteria bacterium]